MFRISTFLKLSLVLSRAHSRPCTSEQHAGGEQKAATGRPRRRHGRASAAATGVPLTPDPGGKVITVELYTDGEGNYFKPAEIHANRGDVVRYTLKVGVHNVHFLADSNAGRSGYPQAPSDFLQLPGQTWDLAVKMPAGSTTSSATHTPRSA